MDATIGELTKKLFSDLGIIDPTPELAEELLEQFNAVILEVLLRRIPEDRLPELREKFEADDPNLQQYVTELAAGVPGLGEEIEAALVREYEVLKSLMKRG